MNLKMARPSCSRSGRTQCQRTATKAVRDIMIDKDKASESENMAEANIAFVLKGERKFLGSRNTG